MGCSTLIININIFNGKDEDTSKGSILIKDNVIATISKGDIPTNEDENITIIDGKGKYLMPGLIDAHWHAYMSCNTIIDILAAEESYTHHVAGKEAEKTLLRGFTTIRDAGGPVFGLKKAIDNNVLNGPRIYPSGAMISAQFKTSVFLISIIGHSDTR